MIILVAFGVIKTFNWLHFNVFSGIFERTVAFLLFFFVKDLLVCANTLFLLLLTGTIFSYFCTSSITSVLILAILIAIVLF